MCCQPSGVDYFLDAASPKAFEAAADFRALVMARLTLPAAEHDAILTELTNKPSNDAEYAALIIASAALMANALASALAQEHIDDTSVEAFGHIVDIAVECGWTI